MKSKLPRDLMRLRVRKTVCEKKKKNFVNNHEMWIKTKNGTEKEGKFIT